MIDISGPPLRTDIPELLFLPVKVRTALDYANARHDAREVLKHFNNDATEDECVQMIINTDAYLLAKEQQHG